MLPSSLCKSQHVQRITSFMRAKGTKRQLVEVSGETAGTKKRKGQKRQSKLLFTANPAGVITRWSDRAERGISEAESAKMDADARKAWRAFFSSRPKPPQCGCLLPDGTIKAPPCVLRQVNKAGSPNFGKHFYVCPLPPGEGAGSRCDFFKWASSSGRVHH